MDRTVIIKQKAPPDERKWDELFRFPVVLGLGVTLMVLAVLSISLQFVGIHYLTYFSTAGAGAWAGVVYLLAACMMVALYCHRLKRLVYGTLAAVIVSLVLSVALLVLFCVGAVNDALLDNSRSWGCAFSHIVTCDEYENNRSTMVTIQSVLAATQFVVLVMCCAVLVEIGRPWISCCRELCGCCTSTETVVYTSHPFAKAGAVNPLEPGMLAQDPRVPIIIDIPKRGVIVNQQVAQQAVPEIETVTNTQPPVSYTIDIPAVDEDMPMAPAVTGSSAVVDVPSAEKERVLGETHVQIDGEDRIYPVVMRSGVPTVVDPARGSAEVTLSPEIQNTVARTFQSNQAAEEATAEVSEVEKKPGVKTFPVMLINGVPTVVDPERGNAPLDVSPELRQTIAESFQHVPGVRSGPAEPAPTSSANKEARFQRRVANIMNELQQQYEGNEDFTVMDPIIVDRR